MSAFLFVFDGQPKPESSDLSHIAGAKIHIWVISKDMNGARKKALSYIGEYGWDVTGEKYAFDVLPEQIDSLEKSELSLYQRALSHGIAADFLSYPKTEGAPDDPVWISRLKKM